MINENSQVFKITFKQQFLVLLPFFVSTIILFCGASVIFHGESITGIILSVYLLTFVLFILPVLILHVQYLINDYRLVVVINSNSKVIEFRKGAITETYSFDDIKSLDYYATIGHISKKGASPVFYSFDNYRFYKLKFSNNISYYLTCLIMNDIECKLERLINVEGDWNFRALPLLY